MDAVGRPKAPAFLLTTVDHTRGINLTPRSIWLDKRKGIIRVTASLDENISHRDGSRRHGGGREEEEAQRLERGMKVDALYRGGKRSYPGTIMIVNRDGTCDIDYDDGEKETRVKPGLITPVRSPPSSSPNRARLSGDETQSDRRASRTLVEGMRVEARYKGRGRFYPGVISQVLRDGSCNIDYDDGETERMVSPSLIKAIDEPFSRSTGADDGRGNDRRGSTDGLETGMKVEARYRGRSSYFPGVVAQVHRDGSCDIDYDAGSKETNVQPSLIRQTDSGSTRTGQGGDDDTTERYRKSDDLSERYTLEKGMRVEARYKGRGRYYPGKLTLVRRDGSCDIDYDDGEREQMVDPSLIKVIDAYRLSSPGRERSPPGNAGLREGVRVEAKYKGRGRYYPGVIARVRRDGSYDIDYDDGEKEQMVDPSLVKTVGKARGEGDRAAGGDSLREGTRVEARYKGRSRYYPGKISRIHRDGACDIDYDDGLKERMVEPSLFRVLRSSSSSSRSPIGRDTTPDNAHSERASEKDGFRQGLKVEARYKGRSRYYPGKITRVYHDGSCDIDYDDGEKERMVESSLIKVLEQNKENSGRSSIGDTLREGMKVEARYKGRGRYYPGSISRVHRDGSCDIDYDDGEKERMVEPSLIKVLGRENDDRSSPTGNALREGMKVEARYKGRGRYYPGKVTRVHRDGSCDIDYDDGEKERMVEPSLIKVLGRENDDRSSPTGNALREGMKVEARYKGRGRYYPGRVTRVHRDGSCDIDYDDGEKERMVEPSLIKVLGRENDDRSSPTGNALREGMKVEARYKGRGRYYPGKVTRVHRDGSCDIDYDDGEKERMVEPSLIKVLGRENDDRSSPTGNALREGMKVEARYKGRGRYYPGRVTRVHRDGSCDIDYDDGEKERMVEPSLIKVLGREKVDGPPPTDDTLREGMKVEARYKGRGRYYPGRVSRVHRNGSCDIDYDDGERERMVEPSLIKVIDTGNYDKPFSGEDTLREGMKVESRYKGRSRYYPGRISQVHRDGSCDIDYDDGEKERMVEPSLMKVLGGGKDERPFRGDDTLREGMKVEARYKGRSRHYPGRISQVHRDGSCDIDYDDGEKERMVEPSLIKVIDTGNYDEPFPRHDTLREGMKVEARYKGRSRYYPGRISQVYLDGSCDIDYDDGEKERMVERSFIHILDKRGNGDRPFPGDNTLREGMKVEARYKGRSRYYPGRISQVHRDGSCNIDYDDGEKERMVEPSLIKILDKGKDERSFSIEGALREGMKVEARYKGRSRYYPGRISQVHRDGSCNIDYDDGEKERMVEASLIKVLDKDKSERTFPSEHALREGMEVEARYKGRNRYYPGRISRVHRDGSCDIDYDDGEKERMVEPSFIRTTSNGEHGGEDTSRESLREGMKVEARYKGRSRYYPGRVSRVHRDGSCDIDYDDGEKERMVNQSLVRPTESRSRSSTRNKSSDTRGRADKTGNSEIGEGSKVEARFRGRSRYHPGKVVHVHQDGSFDIRYDDGDKERMVDPSLVKLVGSPDVSIPQRGSRSEQLRRGQRVEARYKGRSRYYPGVVSRVHGDGSCDIDYDDGEHERMVERSLIKTPPQDHRPPSRGRSYSSSSDGLKEGSRVEARYKGRSRYYPGTVTRVRTDGSVDIDYDDGEQERSVERSLVTPLDPPQRKGQRLSSDRYDSGRIQRSDSRDSRGSDSEGLEEGMKVEADYRGKGRYYPGKIMRIHRDGSCDIDYEDGERERMVDPSSVRRKLDFRPTRATNPRRADSTKNVFDKGDRVEANYRRKGKYFPGSVVQVRHDGTIDISYDDGDEEIRVLAGDVRPVATAHHRSKSSTRMSRDGSRRRSSDEDRRRSGRAMASRRRSRVKGSSDENSDESSRERSLSVSRGGLGRSRLLGANKTGGKYSSSGSDDSQGSLDEGRKSRGRRRSSGSRRPSLESRSRRSSSGGDANRKPRGRSAARRGSRAGGSGASDSEEGNTFSQGSYVEACWHRASPYSRPRRTNNWVSSSMPQNTALFGGVSLSCLFHALDGCVLLSFRFDSFALSSF